MILLRMQENHYKECWNSIVVCSERVEVMVYINNENKKGKVVVGMSGGVDSSVAIFIEGARI